MMAQHSTILVITGVPGAGKSTIANALLQQFPFGIHLPVDSLREWVVAGIAHPVPEWTAETARQFDLARRAAAQTADIYARAGFVVAIDDVISSHEALQYFVQPLSHHQVYIVILQPRLSIALQRNAIRRNKSFDTNILTDVIRQLHKSFQTRPMSNTIVLDTSELTIEDTIKEILAQTGIGPERGAVR